jgi:hypothetical protein
VHLIIILVLIDVSEGGLSDHFGFHLLKIALDRHQGEPQLFTSVRRESGCLDTGLILQFKVVGASFRALHFLVCNMGKAFEFLLVKDWLGLTHIDLLPRILISWRLLTRLGSRSKFALRY